MLGYTRPSLPVRVFVDAGGDPIRYGERWGAGAPPSDSYSVTSNLARFAPLHATADALIAWLLDSYDATVEDSLDAAADLLRPPADAVRAVRVRPADASAAPLTFVFTPFPGIHLHAGLLHDAFFPVCGCDACDETWERCATDLEDTVFGVVSGGLSEGWVEGAELGVWSRLAFEGGSTGGNARAEDYPAERLAAVKDAITPRRDWAPWPASARRSDPRRR